MKTTSTFRVEGVVDTSPARLVADLDLVRPCAVEISYQVTSRGVVDVFASTLDAEGDSMDIFPIRGVADDARAVYHASIAALLSLDVEPVEFSVESVEAVLKASR